MDLDDEKTESGEEPGTQADRLVIQSLMRALDVVEVFGQARKPLSLNEIAKAAGITKSGAQRVAHTLLKRGYLEHAPSGGLLPGRRALDRSFDYLRLNGLVERAVPILIELRRVANERVDLSLFDRTRIIYAARLQSKRETFYATLIGRHVPTFCSSGGRACLALLPDAEMDAILAESELRAITSKTITDPDLIRAKVRDVREDGFALASEEALVGEVVVAAGISDRAGRPLGAIHIAGSLSEWPVEDFRRKFAPLVIEAARALS
jgi:DNA-binding IclR family transcriptional regulator